ncbi:GNAT family acetyltransferase [Aquimarina aggregata]|uniref:GNAT family acetyltransferase n=1 Tax=Aquimarina aggregata TaxID=1642818 RepID=A0A163C7F8_9FLAO|nr:GNAT family N-acetyltransferase [Aquimarina aggregata]KZS42122.1 GNAT family acetyltransferase [Aquimarina aggregata]
MNLEKIRLTKVTLQDAPKLQNIGQQTFYDTYGPPLNTEKNIQIYIQKNFELDQLNIELQNPNSCFYFAKLNDQVVGYLKLNWGNAQTEKTTENTLEIERIYVVKEYQGKKIGNILIQKSIEIGKSKNIDYLWLGVWNKNTKAIKFYKNNGFLPFNKHEFLLGTESQVDIMMKLSF